MNFQITDAGLLAIANASPSGPFVNVPTFKVGSAYGYTPVQTDTALHGSILYTGSIASYVVVNQNLVQWVLIMNETVGDFNFGEIGLYLDSGELFALYALPQLQLKSADPDGNIITITAKMSIAGLAPLVTFEVNSTAITKAIELPGVEFLYPPVSANSTSNLYLADEDEAGKRLLVFRKDDYEWSLNDFVPIIESTVATATATSVTSLDIGDFLADFQVGRYFIQFLTGVHAGFVRKITSQSTNTANFTASLSTAPVAGDQFVIYKSMETGSTGTAGEFSTVDSLSVAGTSGRVYRITRLHPSYLNSGQSTFLVSSAPPFGTVPEWSPSDHSLVFDVTELPNVVNPTGNPSGWVNDTTHLVISSPLTNPTYSSRIPTNYRDLVLSFFGSSDTNKGLMREVSSLAIVDDGITEWIRFTFSTALPNSPVVGQAFKIWYPNLLGGSASGSSVIGGQNQSIYVTAIDSGDGYDYIFDTTPVHPEAMFMYWGTGYISDDKYSITGQFEITLSAGNGIPAGETVNFVERTLGILPGGNTGDVLTKTGPADSQFAWQPPTGVPVPVNPTDDRKVLTANGGLWSWQLASGYLLNSQTFNYTGATATWTKPTGSQYDPDDTVVVRTVAGGGGGAATRNTNDNAWAAGGGSGGGIREIALRYGDLPSTVSLYVGRGGQPRVTSGDQSLAGNSGEDSYFGTYIKAIKGIGGNAAQSGGVAATLAGGWQILSCPIQLNEGFNFSGNGGQAAPVLGVSTQNDGGSCLYGPAGGAGTAKSASHSYNVTGVGGTSYIGGGDGGDAAFGTAAVGGSGVAPGGGGGAVGSSGGNCTSGAGADGRIYVYVVKGRYPLTYRTFI